MTRDDDLPGLGMPGELVMAAVMDPLLARVLEALRVRAVAASSPGVPMARVYGRAAPEFSPSRDGPCPAVVVAPTPGRSVTRRKLLAGRREHVYPVTALMLDSQGQNPQLPPTWRAGWADRMADELQTPFAGVPEVIRVRPDDMVVIDLAKYEQAGLWASVVNLVVTCRMPRA